MNGTSTDSLTSMSGWLSSPVVLLLGFLVTIINLAQFLVLASKWATKRLPSDEPHARVYAAVVVAGLVAWVVFATLSWSTVIAVAAKAGEGHWEALAYPLMLHGISLCGLLMLFDSKARRLPGVPWRPAVFLFLGFGGAAALCGMSGSGLWEVGLVGAIPGVVQFLPVLAVRPRPARSNTGLAA